MVKLEKNRTICVSNVTSDAELTGVAIYYTRSIPKAIHDTGCVPKKTWEIEKLKNFLTGR